MDDGLRQRDAGGGEAQVLRVRAVGAAGALVVRG